MRYYRALTTAAALSGLLLGGATAALPSTAADDEPVLVGTDPIDTTPDVEDGRVQAIAQLGDVVVLGGTFTQLRQRQVTHDLPNIAAFTAHNGQVLTTFAPVLDGEVTALAPADDTSVYVAGRFTHVNGVKHPKVVRLDVQTGQVLAQFDPPPINGQVKDLQVVDGQVLIAGAFTAVAGEPRPGVASLAADSGALTTRLTAAFAGVNNGGRTNVAKLGVQPGGDRLVALGNFTEVDGQPRSQVAVLALAGDHYALTDWATNRFGNVCSKKFNTYVRDVGFAPDGAYFAVVTTGGYHGGDTLCDSATRWEADRSGAGQQPTWVDHTGGDTLDAVAVTDAAVYVGGHMRWFNNPFGKAVAGPGAVPHEGVAALDPATGLPFSWAGRKQRGIGVFDMLATETGLWVGSDTEWFQGELRKRIAFLPLAGGQPIPRPTVAGLPGTVLQLGSDGRGRAADRIRFTALDADGTVGETLSRTTKVKYRRARGAFLVGSTLYTPWSDGRLLARTVTGRDFGRGYAVDLYGGGFGNDAAKVSGAFYDPATSRLYYTLAGRPRLFWRWFNPESQLVGAVRHPMSAGRLPAADLAGLFCSDGRLYFALPADGNLYRIRFDAGVTGAPGAGVIGAPRLVDDSRQWVARGLTVLPSMPQEGRAGVPSRSAAD